MATSPQPVTIASVVKQPYINTNAAHPVREWLERATQGGSIKRCSHAMVSIIHITRTRGDGSDPEKDSFFLPTCEHRSFESNLAHLSQERQWEILRHGLSVVAVRCPKDCTYYENRKWGWVKACFRSVLGVGLKIWRGFRGLPWQTQVGLIALGVVVFAPRWSPAVVQIIKAIVGK